MALKLTPHSSRIDLPLVDPRELVIDLSLSGRARPPSEEAIAERAASMLDPAIGQLQPIIVRRGVGTDKEKVYVVAGFTRALAGMLIVTTLRPAPLGDPMAFKLKCVLTDANPQESLLKNIAENIERNATTAIDDAFNQRRMREELGWTEEQIAKFYKISPAWVGQLRKLLGLPKDIQDKVHEGVLGVSAAIDMADMSEADMRLALEQAKDTPVVDERKQHRVSNATEILQEAGAVNNAKLGKALRRSKAAAGKKVVRTRKEIFEFFESLDGPGSDPAVSRFGKDMLKFFDDLNTTDRTARNAVDRLLAAKPTKGD